MSFQAEMRAALGWRWTEGATFDARLDYARQWLDEHTFGAEAAWSVEHATLPGGHTQTYDLTHLVRYVLGDVLVTALAGVHAMLIVNHSPDGGSLHVGGAGADAWWAPFAAAGGQLVVAPDGAALLASRAAPWPVDQANRNLRLEAIGGDVQYSLALLGVGPGAPSA